MAHPMLSALHALSGDPALNEARQLVIKQSSDATLEEVIQDCLNRNSSRAVRENVASFLLDAVALQTGPQVRDELANVEEAERQWTPEERYIVREEGIDYAHSHGGVEIKQEEDEMHTARRTHVTAGAEYSSTVNRGFARDAPEREPGSGKHHMSVSSGTLEKRVRTSRTTTGHAEPAQAQHESLTLTENSMTRRASADRQDVAMSAPPFTVLMQAIPKITVVFGMPSDGMFKQLDYVSLQIRNHLLRRLKLDYDFDADDKSAYSRILGLGQPPRSHNRCLNKLINGQGPCKWTASNGRERYACDFCIETGRICARLPRGEVYKLAIYSIPVQLRMRIKASELEYWLQEPQKAEIPKRNKKTSPGS